MSDNPSVSVETVIDADPDAVYDSVSDLDLLAGFGTEFVGVEWQKGEPRQVGSVFVGQQRNGDREWTSTSTVVAARPGREFAWRVGLDEATGEDVATWRFSLRRVPDGTEVRYSVVLGSEPSGLTAAIDRHPDAEEQIIEKRLQMFQENMVKTLEGVRRAVS